MQAVTPQTQRKGWESNPQGLAARSRSRRGPSPGRVAHPKVVPGGIEPPISSVSGRRLRHWTTGLSVPRPGVEPGLPRSKRGVMSVSPPGHPAEGEGVEPAFPARGNRVSTAARPPVSGYLPFVSGDGGNRTHPSLFARQTRPPLAHASPSSTLSRPGWVRTTALPRIRGASSRSTTGRTSCGGRIRTGVGRLMRPCWKPTPVHSAMTRVGLEPTHIRLST